MRFARARDIILRCADWRHGARRFQPGQLPHRSARAGQDRRPAVLRRSGFSPEFWRFFSRIALCSLCTIMPLRFVQVYKVCYLCKMLLTIYRKCAKIQTVRDTERTETAGRSGGRAQRRNGPHPGEGERTWSLYTSRRKQIVHGRDFRINSVYKPGKRVSKRVDAGPTRPGKDRNSWLWTI